MVGAPRVRFAILHSRRAGRRCVRPLNLLVRSRMLIRAIAAFVALPGIVAFALPIAIGTSAGRPVQHVTIAAAVLGLGTLLLLWCVREFYVAGRGTLAPWAPPKHLVTTGPYRRSRNPMYVGVITILIGWSILWDSR